MGRGLEGKNLANYPIFINKTSHLSVYIYIYIFLNVKFFQGVSFPLTQVTVIHVYPNTYLFILEFLFLIKLQRGKHFKPRAGCSHLLLKEHGDL